MARSGSLTSGDGLVRNPSESSMPRTSSISIAILARLPARLSSRRERNIGSSSGPVPSRAPNSRPMPSTSARLRSESANSFSAAWMSTARQPGKARLARSGLSARGIASGRLRELGGCACVCGLAVAEDGEGVPAVERIGVRVHGARRDVVFTPLGRRGIKSMRLRERSRRKHGRQSGGRLQRWSCAHGAGWKLWGERMGVARRDGERLGVDGGLLEQELCGGTE